MATNEVRAEKERDFTPASEGNLGFDDVTLKGERTQLTTNDLQIKKK